ncbi:MAG: hypothetical protein Q7U54_14905 [Bacteroidales bacterium]|nr:hypothetical protein [Bacteroidales bacterium]
MIRFLQHDKIDKSSWDDCIDNAVNGNLYACSWYLDIVSPGWCALIEDDYENVFPLPVSTKAGFSYIMQPIFTQQLGLFYKSISAKNKLEEFLNCIPAKYRYIDFNLNTSNEMPASVNVSEMTNLELGLISEYKDLISGYQNNLQRNLRKAAQNNFTISKHVRPEEIISLFRANKGQELTHLNNRQYAMLQDIADKSINKGIGEIWGAYDEFNQLLAAILWVSSHQKAIFLFSALSGTGKKLNAMPWLIDSFIKQNAGNPLVLDFEGSNMEGLARFYSSFGAKKVMYQRYIRTSLPPHLRIGLKLWRLSKMQLKKYFLLAKQ